MTFAELSMRIQQMLRPYHVMPAIDTLLALSWLNDGLDGEKQILPVIEETIERKKKAGKPIPTSLKYYDSILKGLKAAPEPNKINENEQERDLRLAKQYRWKIETIKNKEWIREERALADLERKYGAGFGMEKASVTTMEASTGR